MSNITLTAYPVKQGGTTFYLSALPAADLIDDDHFRVDHWNATNQEGYQREINQSHAHRLARYLGKAYVTDDDNTRTRQESGKSIQAQAVTTNALPSSIVINFRHPLAVTPIPDSNGAVSIKLDEWPGYFIDGQHRIEAVKEILEQDENSDLAEYEFAVTLTNFSLEEEMIHFRNLNSTANRPPKGLNEAISHSLYAKYGRTPASFGEVSRNRATGITMHIATDQTSPWYGKIALGGVRKRAMHTTVQSQFTQSMMGLFNRGRFSDPSESLDRIYDLENNFWLAVQAVWPEAVNNVESSMIQRPGGFFPLHRLLERIFNNLKLNPTEEDFTTLLQAIRSNAGLTGNGWVRHVGTIDQLRLGYSENRGYVIVADYLWNAIDDATKAKVKTVE